MEYFKEVDGERTPMTQEETDEYLLYVEPDKTMQIEILKAQLQATDYKALKYFEGWLTDEEYAPIKAERQAIRDKINELEQSE